jgi:biopolymer transport protein ExbD
LNQAKEKQFIDMKRIIFIILGFIVLIAWFFLYSTSMSEPEAILLHTTDNKPDTLNLLLPKSDDNGNSKYEKIETKLTLILLGNNLIYGYSGNNVTTGKAYNYAEVRTLIKQESTKYPPEKFVITIRPAETATYKNTIDILDEMTINNIKKYEVIGISDKEKKIVQQFEQALKK